VIEVDGIVDSFMSFSDGIIHFFGLNSEYSGNHTLTVRLIDTQGAQTSYEIVFDIVIPEEEEEEEESSSGGGAAFSFDMGSSFNQGKEVEVKKKDPVLSLGELRGRKDILKGRAESLTILGELEVVFSTSIKTEEFDLTHLNSTYIDMYIVPANDRD
jgi:hypothetical protein